MPLYPRTVIVAFHDGNSAFIGFQGEDVVNSFTQNIEASCFPDGLGYEVDYHYATDSIGKVYDQSPETPVTIEINSKTWNPDTRMVDLTYTMRNDGPDLDGEYRYNVIVTEDNIKVTRAVADSCGTPSAPGQPYVDTTYFSFAVARKLVFYSKGDSLVGPSWFGQLAITRSCSFSIDSAWIPYNCNIIVNVYKKADSLYKSPVLQVIKESITNPSAIPDESTVEQGIIGIFPNPATDITNLHFSSSSETFCSLNIYDLKGNKMKNIIDGYVKPGLYNVEIDMEVFLRGTYIVVLETNEGMQTRKIIKL